MAGLVKTDTADGKQSVAERGKVKLHLGCGAKFLPGYVHMDVQPHVHVDRIGDISDLSAFADESVDEIYACHVLEHFRRQDMYNVLTEWNRVLKVGGLIR